MAKEWSPHRYLVAAARKVWRWSPDRREILKKAKAGKDLWTCEKCKATFGVVEMVTKKGRRRKRMGGAVDHIIPIGKQPTKWSDYTAYYKRMFCSITNLQVLCTACHAPKSKAERSKK